MPYMEYVLLLLSKLFLLFPSSKNRYFLGISKHRTDSRIHFTLDTAISSMITIILMHLLVFLKHEPGMDHQKLMRMKRRKEKNRECSRQFRLKQKNKEENLKNGKTEKLRILESLRRNVENLKTTLSNVAAQCCSECPKTRMLLQQHVLGDKENINPDFMKITK